MLSVEHRLVDDVLRHESVSIPQTNRMTFGTYSFIAQAPLADPLAVNQLAEHLGRRGEVFFGVDAFRIRRIDFGKEKGTSVFTKVVKNWSG